MQRQSVYPWRDGVSLPDLERLLQISKLTGHSVDWLLKGGEGDEGPEGADSKVTPDTPVSRPLRGGSLGLLTEIVEKIEELSPGEREQLNPVLEIVSREIDHVKRDPEKVARPLVAASTGGRKKQTRKEKRDLKNDTRDAQRDVEEIEQDEDARKLRR